MTKEQRINAFAQLGHHLRKEGPDLQAAQQQATQQNAWFTEENVHRATQSLATLLTTELLENWLSPYPFSKSTDRTVGLVCAGNIPLVGAHDILAILLSGFRLQIKLSSDDTVLPRFLLQKLIEIEPQFEHRIHFVDRLRDFDLVIATGSDNTARYFLHYFEKYPHIIRRNRHSVAILGGNETAEQLHLLGADIFSNFGLGCRNVSKLYVPAPFDPAPFYEGIAAHEHVSTHHKYRNNYDFHKSIYLINGDLHWDNGFLLLKPDRRLASPLAVLYYEEYTSLPELIGRIKEERIQIQCLVSESLMPQNTDLGLPQVPFGQSQFPGLQDYADGVDTLGFLAKYCP